MTDTHLDALAACLDELEAMADKFARLHMHGVAGKLRALAARLEERATEPQPPGVTA